MSHKTALYSEDGSIICSVEDVDKELPETFPEFKVDQRVHVTAEYLANLRKLGFPTTLQGKTGTILELLSRTETNEVYRVQFSNGERLLSGYWLETYK